MAWTRLRFARAADLEAPRVIADATFESAERHGRGGLGARRNGRGRQVKPFRLLFSRPPRRIAATTFFTRHHDHGPFDRCRRRLRRTRRPGRRVTAVRSHRAPALSERRAARQSVVFRWVRPVAQTRFFLFFSPPPPDGVFRGIFFFFFVPLPSHSASHVRRGSGVNRSLCPTGSATRATSRAKRVTPPPVFRGFTGSSSEHARRIFHRNPRPITLGKFVWEVLWEHRPSGCRLGRVIQSNTKVKKHRSIRLIRTTSYTTQRSFLPTFKSLFIIYNVRVTLITGHISR